MKPIVIIQGAQWGSEAKGMVALALCELGGVDIVVRTGSINAGHTIILGGSKTAFQQLPVGAVLPGMEVVIGPGAYINKNVLDRETELSGCRERLFLDNNCGVHLDSYSDEAAVEKRNLKIGATGKGCAEAIIHKIKDRGVGVPLLFREELGSEKYAFTDTALKLTKAALTGKTVMIEGTQGALLDFHCGPYPFVTSRQTLSSSWVSEAGLSPSLEYQIVLVARTYPIRVAGNSGPMPNETDWVTLAKTMNARLQTCGLTPLVAASSLAEFEDKLAVVRSAGGFGSVNEESLMANTKALLTMSKEGLADVLKLFETTTVTKRLRRIAALDLELLKITVLKERPAYLVLTFLNYVFPELPHEGRLHGEARKYVDLLQEKIGCHIKYVTVGPRSRDLWPTNN